MWHYCTTKTYTIYQYQANCNIKLTVAKTDYIRALKKPFTEAALLPRQFVAI